MDIRSTSLALRTCWYQVLKKWLSYRESALLGRPLTPDEAQHFTHHVRRIASILALHEKLDAHYGASV